jgi:aspartate aminotransferase-like enzyme
MEGRSEARRQFLRPGHGPVATASRFDSSISWVAAIGNEAALATFDAFGTDAVFARNREVAAALRAALTDIGRRPLERPAANRSTIVALPLSDTGGPELVEQLQ